MKHLALFIVLLFVGVLPVFGQDATAESTVPAGSVTVIDGEGQGDTIINVEGAETPSTPVETPATNVLSISNIISFLIGGVVFAGGVMAYLGTQARAALNDPAKMVIAEKLGDSVPAETANKLIDGLTGVLEFLKEATDRKPALLKPSPNSSVSGVASDFTSTAAPLP